MSGTPGAGTRLSWYKIHKYLGLATLVFLAGAAVTGVLLVFDKDLDAALNPDLFAAPPHLPRIEPAALAARLEAADPRLRVIAVPLQVPDGNAVLLSVAARITGTAPTAALDFDQVFVDPSNGSVLGVRHNGPGSGRRHLMQDIYTLHTTLFAGLWGGRIMGAIGLLWLIESLVGLYLTLPRRGVFFAKWKPAWTVRWRGHWLRFLLDLHRATGLWALPVMVIFAYSSFGIGLYYEALEPLVTAFSRPRPSPFDTPPAPSDGHAPALGFARAIEVSRAAAQRDGVTWRPAVASYLPDRALYGVMFTRSGREEYSGLGPITYYLDDRTAALRLIDSPYDDTNGEKILRATYPIHSGQIGGSATRWGVLILGLVGLEMFVTALIVWWRKRLMRLRAQAN